MEKERIVTIGETYEDKKGDVRIKDIVLLYSAMDVEGETYQVKTTVKRYKDPITKTKAYSYEVKEIEPLMWNLGTKLRIPPTHQTALFKCQSTNNFIPRNIVVGFFIKLSHFIVPIKHL